MSSGYRGDVIGRVLGAIVFIGGVVLLGVVFRLAYGLFMTNADQALGLVFTGNPYRRPRSTHCRRILPYRTSPSGYLPPDHAYRNRHSSYPVRKITITRCSVAQL